MTANLIFYSALTVIFYHKYLKPERSRPASTAKVRSSSKQYDKNTILEVIDTRHQFEAGRGEGLAEININVNKNEVFGLLGSNGSGKSTLLNIMTGKVKQDQGETRIMGRKIFDNINEARSVFSFVQQDDFLFNELTVS